MDNRRIYIVQRDYQQGLNAIVGVYPDEKTAKEVMRVVSKYSTEHSFSITAHEITFTTAEDCK